MSYNLTLGCGCSVYVSCHPITNEAHTRVIEQRGTTCRNRRHDIGTRVWLWEILPEPEPDARAARADRDRRTDLG